MDFTFLAAGLGLAFAGYGGYKYLTSPQPISFPLPAGAVSNLQKSDYDMEKDLLKQCEHVGNGVYRRTAFRDELIKTFLDANTLYDCLRRGARLYPNANCLGFREIDSVTGKAASQFTWLNYSKTLERTTNFASGLIHLGFEPKKHTLGIYSKNRVEWTIASEACNTQNIVSVALYDTFGKDNIRYIIDHAELRGIVCHPSVLKNLFEVIPQLETHNLKYIILMPNITKVENNEDFTTNYLQDAKEKAKNLNVELLFFEEIEKMGQEHHVQDNPPKPDDLAILMYTSGTTGRPKGVMLLQKNVIATAAGVLDVGWVLTPADVFPSYLPLAHILQRACEAAMLAMGVGIGYWQGEITKLMDDLATLRPTVMCGVPRVFEKIKSGLQQKLEEGSVIQKKLFDYAFEQKRKAMLEGKTSPFWDRVVFKKIQQRIGGRLRGFISGGAPLRRETQEFIFVIFGVPIAQGYGLTETAAGGTLGLYWDKNMNGKIGPPLSCLEIKLIDVPDMNYFQSKHQGEIAIRGHNVFPGYFKDPELTAQSFDSEGFFLTGDIGQMNEDGSFSIIDRKKNLIKLPQGEYVSLERVETVALGCNFVEQIYVHADSHNLHLIAIIIPSKVHVLNYAAANGLKDSPYQQILNNKQFRQTVLNDLLSISKAQGLNSFEMIRNCRFDTEPFTLENNTLTPTMKLKRSDLKNKYSSQIEEMFNELNEADASRKKSDMF